MDEPIADREDDLRQDCLEFAHCLNGMRAKPKEEASEIIADAALFEHYVTNGMTVTIMLSEKLSKAIRNPTT